MLDEVDFIKMIVPWFRHACLDSYRALTLRPTWEKPYYRCAEAWHRMGEVAFAMAINKQGQALASTYADLSTQLYSFRTARLVQDVGLYF